MSRLYYPKRARSIMRGENPKTQVGYTGKGELKRKDGDCWTDENGKEWEMKNGISRSIPKFQDVRVPLFCPKCNKPLGKSQKDSEIYWKFGFCLNCLIERDTEMIIDGSYQEYQSKYMNDKTLGLLLEYKEMITEYIKKIKNGIEIVNEDGKIEKWTGDEKKVKDFWKKELKEINKSLKKFKKNEKIAKNN